MSTIAHHRRRQHARYNDLPPIAAYTSVPHASDSQRFTNNTPQEYQRIADGAVSNQTNDKAIMMEQGGSITLPKHVIEDYHKATQRSMTSRLARFKKSTMEEFGRGMKQLKRESRKKKMKKKKPIRKRKK